jgi:hypothetical protein
MVDLGVALGMIAPYYNLVMVLVALLLFTKLFKTEPKAKVYLFPWILIFFALLVFVLEEIITVIRAAGLIDIPIHINGFFELVIVAAFMYALLLQKQYVQKRFG